ncbi:Dabb family protein [Arthrobacter sp. ISL-85]|uniref:Dabb family protein n=1 Tax=Arthrobacter sp. ISL-85 TaxID=2819115 RepID=UPI001BE739E6|nr:Dabb family protein [Arthrobacter sp. ISL-85]MBT2568165.1 Dabb family protein [Arthrobacter sp. ISL-85]
MIRHIVMFTFRENAPGPERTEAILTMEDLLRTQRYGLSTWLGRDAGLAPGNASIAIMIDFPDPQAFLDFQASNEHLETIRRIRPVIATRSAIQSATQDY